MDFEEAKQRVTALREQIEYHSRRYYDLDDPEIEDSEFDALTRELRTLETDYPQLVTADSYTQRVHGCLLYTSWPSTGIWTGNGRASRIFTGRFMSSNTPPGFPRLRP